MDKQNINRKIIESSSLFSTEFLKGPDTYYDGTAEIPCISIDMNPHSLTLLLKGYLFKNSSSIFLISLINLFQSLKINTTENSIPYHAYTQSLVVYYLRRLAQKGLIRITYSKRDKFMYLDDKYFYTIGNIPRDHQISMYDVLFLKVRDLDSSDIDMIKDIMHTFHIDENEIEFNVRLGRLRAQHNRKEFKNNTYTVKEMGKRLSLAIKDTKNK